MSDPTASDEHVYFTHPGTPVFTLQYPGPIGDTPVRCSRTRCAITPPYKQRDRRRRLRAAMRGLASSVEALKGHSPVPRLTIADVTPAPIPCTPAMAEQRERSLWSRALAHLSKVRNAHRDA